MQPCSLSQQQGPPLSKQRSALLSMFERVSRSLVIPRNRRAAEHPSRQTITRRGKKKNFVVLRQVLASTLPDPVRMLIDDDVCYDYHVGKGL